jgi:hypothetical protein
MTWRHFFSFSLDHDPAADAGDFTVPQQDYEAMIEARDQAGAQFWASLRAEGAPIAGPEADPEPGSFAEKYADSCAQLDAAGPGADAGTEPEPEVGG